MRALPRSGCMRGIVRSLAPGRLSRQYASYARIEEKLCCDLVSRSLRDRRWARVVGKGHRERHTSMPAEDQRKWIVGCSSVPPHEKMEATRTSRIED